MKKLIVLSLLALFLSPADGVARKRKLDNVFYCFNNAMRLPNAPKDPKDQALLAKRLGYDGISGSGEEAYPAFRKGLDEAGLAMPEIYIPLRIDQGVPPYNPLLKEVIRDSRKRDLLVTLHLHSDQYKDRKEEGDRKFAEVLTELADYAARYKVKLAIYPHYSFYCEDVDHCLKLAGMVNRPNLGVVVNLCHYLKVAGENGLGEQLLKALPHLFMFSLCGADKGDTKTYDWDRLIRPLGEGSYDPYPLVKLLKDHGYKGKFGLQCYNIKMDAEENLARSMAAWKSFRQKYESGQ